MATVLPIPPALRYVSDTATGIRRRRNGSGFIYLLADGSKLTDPDELARIRSIAVPPAWRDVWICADERGHVQATGRDARGRKQYRYHRAWREFRDRTKFERLVAFGEALPTIRERTGADLARSGLPRERVLAAVVDLLDRTLIRVGNEEYARDNGSFGLTTLLADHVDVDGSELRFTFVGKGGKEHRTGLRDRRLAALVRRVQDLPGHRLFQYVDDDGAAAAVDSDDVNEYLRATAGEDFSAKDFRTWGATAHVVERLVRRGGFDAAADGNAYVMDAVRSAAKRLGNSATVTRKSYVHPAVVAAYLDGTLLARWGEAQASVREPPEGLTEQEAVLLAVLRGAGIAGPARKSA